MSFTNWLRKLQSFCQFGSTSRISRRASRFGPAKPPRLQLECLEDRCLPSTYTVTNLLDSGTGSLRAAITAANANPGADSIDFATTGTIALTSGQMDVTDSVTISGPGAGALTVSGNHVSRVFRIAGDPTVTIADLTVANGSTWGSPGGGISMAGGTVILDHVSVSGNSAVGDSGWPNYDGGNAAGGGLYVAGGTLTLDQSTVSGNSAWGGPGVDGPVTGGAGGGGAGGGLYIVGGTVHVNQSAVSGNHAEGGNGGYGSMYYGFDGTGGNGGSGLGGCIFVADGTVEFYQSTISGNTAVGGGAGFGDYYNGANGGSSGGGLYISYAVPPRADLDTFTEFNTINNFADGEPSNISGPYSLNGTWVPALAIGDVSTLERNSGTSAITFTVSLAAASNQTITVGYATADGSATAGSDYQAASGTLTIPAGQTSGTITVLVNGDRLVEPNESFFVNLRSPTNATIADGTGVVTIVDDEPRVSIGDVTRTEGNTGTTLFAFTVSLSAVYDAPVTVNFATTGGTATAGSDYQATSGTLTIPVGQTSGTVSVLGNGDRLGEANETFSVNLSNPVNAGITDGQGVGTIVDDEPRVIISGGYVREGNSGTSLCVFTVRLSSAYDEPVVLSYATVDDYPTFPTAYGIATAGSDFQSTSGTLTFAPGETSKTFTVSVIGDRLGEPNEVFYVDLGGATNAVITDGRGGSTILDDEPRISVGDVTRAEGKNRKTTLFTFTVTLSAAYDQPVAVPYRTVDGTATTSDGDYVGKAGTLTFAPGETTKTITIVVNGDGKREADETFYLDLFGLSSNSLFTNSRGIGTILNDD